MTRAPATPAPPEPSEPAAGAPVDLRLAGAALGAWIGAWWCLGGGPSRAVGVAVLAALAGVVCAAVLWRGSRADGRGRLVGGRRVGRGRSVGGRAVGGGRLVGGRRVDRERSGHLRPRGLGRSVGGGRLGFWGSGSGAPGRSGTAAILAGCALGTLIGALACAPRLAVRDGGQLARLARSGASVEMVLAVGDDPRPARGGRPGAQIWVVDATADRLMTPGRANRVSGRVLVLADDQGWRGLLPGQRVRVRGQLLAPQRRDLTAAVLRTGAPPELVGRAPWIQRVAGRIRAGLRRACVGLPNEPGGLLPGLVDGDTSTLDPGIQAAFTQTGLTHLTAVSGANLAIVAGLILALARRARAGPVRSAVLAAAIVAGFVVLARPSPSVVRAAAMCGIGLLALALGRPSAALPALSASILALVVYDPALAAAPGFALSAAATAGLLVIAPGWTKALHRRGVPHRAAEALAVPAAAHAACAPLLAAMTGSVSLSAVPANLLAEPAVAPATVLGLLAAVTSVFAPPLATGLAWLGQWPTRWLVLVAEHGAAVPDGLVPWPSGAAGGWSLAILLVVMAFACRWRVSRRVLAVVVAAVVVATLPVRVAAPGWPPAAWVMVGCDVGQGDALVLHAGPGSAVVIDAGPDPMPVDGCLRRLGVVNIPLIVISHLHLDHVGGLAGVVRRRRVGAIGVGVYGEPATGRVLLRRIAAGARLTVVTLRAGQQVTAGDVTLRVLGPTTVFRGTRSDPNNNSLVVRARVGPVSILLPGDAEHDAEQALLDAGAPLAVDVLKVPHHGSAYSEPAFLDAARARIAVVEVGAHNDYGHPNPGVIAHLRQHGAKVLRTDLDGDVAVVRSGGGGLATVIRGRSRAGGP